MKNRSNGTFIVVVIIIGIFELLNALLLGHIGGVTQVIKIILGILAAILIFLSGRKSKYSHGHPSGLGALLGAIFGLFAGIIGLFTTHVTLNQRLQIKGQGQISTDLLRKSTEISISTKMHVVILILTVVIYMVIGLIIAFIGGATTRKKD